MPSNPSSAPAPTNLPEWLRRLIAALDPDYPAVVVAGDPDRIDEPAAGYLGPVRNPLLAEDERGWGDQHD